MLVARKDIRFPKSLLEPIRHVLESRDFGVTQDDLLAQLGVSRVQYDDPSFSVNADDFIRLNRWVRERTQGRIRLKEWLSSYSATSIGLAGLATLSSLSGRDAIAVGIRYMPLLAPVLRAELIEGPQTCRIVITLTTDLEEMGRVMLELSVGVMNIISHETMGEAIPRTIHFRHDCGTDNEGRSRLAEYREAYGCEVVFNSDFDGFTSDSKFLDYRTRSPNEATSRLARSILDGEIEARMASQSLASFVRNELARLARDGKFPSIEDFADSIHQSPRNFARKLAREDTSFKDLSNDVWFSLAQELLTGTSLTIDQVAHRTGFTCGSSFGRAFKSRSGETPVNWRRTRAPQQR